MIMRNKITFIFSLGLLLVVVVGCSRINPLGGGSSGSGTSNDGTVTDKAVDTVVGTERIGVPECDEVMDFFDREMNDPNDGAIAKAVKATILNKMKESFRTSLEQNKTDKVELAKTCKDFKANLDKYKAEEDAKK